VERLPAIIVGSVDVGESSRIVKLLTAERGRVDAFARGARGSKKRFGAAIEPGTRIVAELKRGKGLPGLSVSEVTAIPMRARDDLHRLAALAYGCELCAALAPEDGPAEKLHGLLASWLDRLEAGAVGSACRLALEAKALTFGGLAPALVRCPRCGLPLEDPVVADPGAGGLLHEHCGNGVWVPAASGAAVEALRRTPLASIGSEGAPPGMATVLADFAEWHLGHGLRSRALLLEVEATGPPRG
jgi:DNA repair protein RecO (recombination protein O)